MLTPVVLSPKARLAPQHLSKDIGDLKDRLVKAEALLLDDDGRRVLWRIEPNLTEKPRPPHFAASPRGMNAGDELIFPAWYEVIHDGLNLDSEELLQMFKPCEVLEKVDS